MHRSSRRSRKGRFARNTIHHIDSAASGFGRWVTTDHTGFTDAMLAMPKMGFLESLRYIFFQFVIHVGSAILAALLFSLLIAFGLPWLISVLLILP
jgi:hypothetical protein